MIRKTHQINKKKPKKNNGGTYAGGTWLHVVPPQKMAEQTSITIAHGESSRGKA